MKRYEIRITLANGDEVRMRVQARNKADALLRAKADSRFYEFAEGKGGVVSEEVTPIPIASIDNTRFCVTNIENKQGWYVVADLENRIKVEFKKGHYNDMQKVTNFAECADALKEATALREIADYMSVNFKELI